MELVERSPRRARRLLHGVRIGGQDLRDVVRAVRAVLAHPQEVEDPDELAVPRPADFLVGGDLPSEAVGRQPRVRLGIPRLRGCGDDEDDRRQDRGDKVRLVDARIERIDFSSDAYKAGVEVQIRYYEVPFYVVRSRHETEQWAFSLSDGWKVEQREVKDDGR